MKEGFMFKIFHNLFKTKTYCDKCQKEIISGEFRPLELMNGGCAIVCQECSKEISEIIKDFNKKTKEEI